MKWKSTETVNLNVRNRTDRKLFVLIDNSKKGIDITVMPECPENTGATGQLHILDPAMSDENEGA